MASLSQNLDDLQTLMDSDDQLIAVSRLKLIQILSQLGETQVGE